MDEKTSNVDKKGVDEEFKCPVCFNLFLKPTLFECGHSFCLTCHYNLDKNTPSSTFSLPIYKCPLCRSASSVGWNDRPLNISLNKVCSKMYPEETNILKNLDAKCAALKKMLESKKTEPETIVYEDYTSINLSQTSSEAQRALSQKVYTKLMPAFLKAAKDGKSHLQISDRDLVSEIEICIIPLTKLLFENNNVYQISCTPEDCTVMFSKCSLQWGREFHNENHEEAQATVSPPPRTLYPLRGARRRRLRPEPREGTIDQIIMGDVRTLLGNHLRDSGV